MNIVIILPVLLYAGIYDAKKRIIPDKVHLALILIGIVEIIFTSSDHILYIDAIERSAGMLIPSVVLFMVYVINKKASGGGDFKLLASLGFCVGISYLIKILIITFLSVLLFNLLKRQKTIPLAPFIFVGAALSCWL